MVCERNNGVLHWLSHTAGSMCYHCISDMYTPYSILGLSGHWNTNGKVATYSNIYYLAMYCILPVLLFVFIARDHI